MDLILICSQLSYLAYPGLRRDYVPGVTMWNQFEDVKTDTQGYIYLYLDYIIIVYRGSHSLKDIKTDVDISKQESEYGNWRCHQGFYDASRSVYNCIWDIIRPLFKEPGRKLVVTGHSLGGALAAEFATTGAPKYLITFGQPCLGGQLCADQLTKVFSGKWTRYIRVVNGPDFVPRLLEDRVGYVHSGDLLYIATNRRPYFNTTKWFRFRDRFWSVIRRFTKHSGKRYYTSLVYSQNKITRIL